MLRCSQEFHIRDAQLEGEVVLVCSLDVPLPPTTDKALAFDFYIDNNIIVAIQPTLDLKFAILLKTLFSMYKRGRQQISW
jgi:uncharacterized protein (AIM24 family)